MSSTRTQRHRELVDAAEALPASLAALATAAAEDLRQEMDAGRLEFAPHQWLIANREGQPTPCAGCLAGAWLLGERIVASTENASEYTLWVEDNRPFEPTDVPARLRLAMRTLDEIRNGNWTAAARNWYAPGKRNKAMMKQIAALSETAFDAREHQNAISVLKHGRIDRDLQKTINKRRGDALAEQVLAEAAALAAIEAEHGTAPAATQPAAATA